MLTASEAALQAEANRLAASPCAHRMHAIETAIRAAVLAGENETRVLGDLGEDAEPIMDRLTVAGYRVVVNNWTYAPVYYISW